MWQRVRRMCGKAGGVSWRRRGRRARRQRTYSDKSELALSFSASRRLLSRARLRPRRVRGGGAFRRVLPVARDSWGALAVHDRA